MEGIFDITAVSIVVLSLTAFILTWHINTNERYLINLEYYSLETFLNSKINGTPVYEDIMLDKLSKEEMKSTLNKIIPRGYNYLFEIPKYNFRATNVNAASKTNTCIQINKIYAIEYNFNGINLIFGVWSKSQKYKVVPCEG